MVVDAAVPNGLPFGEEITGPVVCAVPNTLGADEVGIVPNACVVCVTDPKVGGAILEDPKIFPLEFAGAGKPT